MNHELLTIDEVADLVLTDAETVRKWLARGLPASEQGGEPRIRRADLDAFLAREGQGQARDAAEEV